MSASESDDPDYEILERETADEPEPRRPPARASCGAQVSQSPGGRSLRTFLRPGRLNERGRRLVVREGQGRSPSNHPIPNRVRGSPGPSDSPRPRVSIPLAAALLIRREIEFSLFGPRLIHPA